MVQISWIALASRRVARPLFMAAAVLFALSAFPTSVLPDDADASLRFEMISVQSLMPVLAETYGVNLVQTGAVPGQVSVNLEG